MEIPAPEQGYPSPWAKGLIRTLADAPATLHIETLVDADTHWTAPPPGGG